MSLSFENESFTDATLQIIEDLLLLLDVRPGYRVVTTHLALYAWLKQMAPDLYKQIRARIETQQWQVKGALWAPSETGGIGEVEGEALLRQIVHAKSFFQQEFGTESKELWLADVHGASAALPQILLKAGIERLVVFPLGAEPSATSIPTFECLWQGIEGTRVPVLWLSSDEFDYEAVASSTTPNGEGTMPLLLLAKPATSLRSAVTDTARLPVWRGELEHLFAKLVPADTMTSLGDRILDNRRLDNRILDNRILDNRRLDNRRSRGAGWVGGLRDAEFLSVIDPTGLRAYPRPQLDRAWKSSFMGMGETPIDLIAPAMQALVATVDTRGLKRPAMVVSNLSHYSNEAVALPLREQERDPVAAIGPEGDVMPVQIVMEAGRRQALFVARNAPLHGYAIWDLAGTTVPPIVPVEERVVVGSNSLENDVLRAEFDTSTGLLIRLYDKDSEREVLKDTFEVEIDRRGNRVTQGALIAENCGNQLQLWHATGGERDPAEVRGGERPILERMEVVEGGPVRGAIRFTYRIGAGAETLTMRQTVRLTIGSARLDFQTELSSVSEEIASPPTPIYLLASFPVAINSNYATYEIPYGHVERPTYDNHLIENFIENLIENLIDPPVSLITGSDPSNLSREMSSNRNKNLHTMRGQKWIDLSEGDYGVALLNTVGRGSALHRVLADSISILVAPNMLVAEGKRIYFETFTYSLLPHGSDFRDGEVVENAYALNSPPTVTSLTGNQPGKLPIERSFFEVDNVAVFIEAIKRAEGEDALIVRLYEGHNTRGKVVLSCRLPVRRASLCDLMETEVIPLSLSAGDITLPVQPFEIITIKLFF